MHYIRSYSAYSQFLIETENQYFENRSFAEGTVQAYVGVCQTERCVLTSIYMCRNVLNPNDFLGI